MSQIDYILIWNSLHGQISAEEEVLLNSWIDADPKHRAYYQKVEVYVKNGSSFDQLALDKERLFLEVSKEVSFKTTDRRIHIRWWLAASVVLVIGVLSIWRLQHEEVAYDFAAIKPGSKSATLVIDNGWPLKLDSVTPITGIQSGGLLKNENSILQYSNTKPSKKEPEMHCLITPKGGDYQVILSDGTKIWLNADSKLTYPDRFVGEERRVELVGEAYFEVARDENSPFIIQTKNQEIKVYGTSFNISAYLGDAFEHTALAEGSVGIIHEGLESRIRPGQMFYLDKIFNRTDVKEVDIYTVSAWKDQSFYFEDKKLSEIMVILSRWYDFNYVFDDPDKKDLLLTGGFKRHEAFASIIKRIQLINEVNFTIEANQIVIQ